MAEIAQAGSADTGTKDRQGESTGNEEAGGRPAPVRVLHIITRMILGGAQENTLLSVVG